MYPSNVAIGLISGNQHKFIATRGALNFEPNWVLNYLLTLAPDPGKSVTFLWEKAVKRRARNNFGDM